MRLWLELKAAYLTLKSGYFFRTQEDRMSKKYIIILVIVVAAAGGLYYYLNYKKEQDLRAHHDRQFARIIKMAQKSSIAGMVQMARALNQYKEKNGSYPPKLSALHPDFIPVKAFIDDIQWDYKPSINDFDLSKTIKTPKGKVLTASIGPDLMPQDNSGTMVASAQAAKPAASRVKSKAPGKPTKTGADGNQFLVHVLSFRVSRSFHF